jgi:N-acetylneuraminic acid mutarotase
MQKIFSIVLVALLVLAVNLTFGQAIKVSQVSSPTTVDVGPQCSGGQIHDDGVAENGYGWNATAGNPSGWASKFIPTVYPYKFTKFCIGLTRLSTGVANFTFTITMWKSVNGMPTVPFNTVFMDTVTVTAAGLPVWPAVSFFDFPLPSTWANVTGTDSVFIGIKYDPVTMSGVFVASDESTTTPLWPGYCTTAAGPWTTIQSNSTFAAYRSLLFRAEGGSAAPTPCSNFSSSWTTGLAVIPDGATNCSRVIPSGIIINDTGYLYVMGGGTPVNINRCYNTVTNTWTTKTAMPIALATTNGTTIKDSIYIIGGYIGTGTSGAVYRYNPRTDSWATNAPMPLATNTADMCIVPWRDSLIICAGGGPGLFSSSAATTAVRYYNVYTNSWVDLAGSSLLPVAQSMMASTIVGDTIYIFGGYTIANITVGTAYRGIITPGSPISITWTAIASLPGTFNTTGKTYRSSAATIKSVNGGVLIVGGADDVGNYNGTAYLYNPCGNTYTTLTSAAGSAKSNMGARLYAFKDSVIYLAAGYNAAGQTSVLKFAGRCYNCTVSGIVGQNGEIPETYSLSQNYPNPFNPETKINYALPKSGLVTLKIYDVLGREVMTLVNEMKSAGNYIVDFNGANLSSGIYFYSLKSGDFTSVKKMTLIK